MKLADLKPAPYNPRKIDKDVLAGLGRSLHEFGDISGIVWNSQTGHLVAGHQRLDALRAEHGDRLCLQERNGGLLLVTPSDTFSVRVVDWPQAQEQAANIAANNPHIAGEFKQADLDKIIGDLGETDYASLLKPLRIDELLSPKQVHEDDVPEPPEEPITKLGDLWTLGEHRVLCGDSMSADVDDLMQGERVGLCFTSPPYAQQRDYEKQIDDWDGLMRGVFGRLPMTNDGQVLVNLGLIHRDCEWIPYWDAWIEWMRSQGWRRFGWYVWDQGFGLPGDWNGRFGPSHEWIFHFNKVSVQPNKWTDKQPENVKPRAHGQSTMRRADGKCTPFTNPGASAQARKVPDSIVRICRQVGTDGHPAQFPVGLPAAAIASWPCDVYDPFLGSGTTLIAAEQLGRRCYGIEIEPKYCDVVVARWEKLTGRKAERAQL